MYPRTKKELQPLFLPWALAAAAILGSFAGSYLSMDVSIVRIAGLTLGTAFLAARTFSAEFQEKTVTLWLIQPVSRSRLLGDKFLALSFPVVVLALFFVASTLCRSGDALSPEVLGVCGLSIAASAVSAPFLGVVARSAIGTFGCVFTAQYVALILFVRFRDPVVAQIRFLPNPDVCLGVVASFLYFGAFGYLGWRSHAQLQDTGGARAVAGGSSWLPRVLRTRRIGALRNLVRKEVTLHRVTFLIAGVFLAVMCVVWLLNLLGGAGVRQFLEIARLIPFAADMLITVILSGCIAFTEERSLGTYAWSITQPVGIMRQFLVKFSASLAVFLLLGLLVPFLVAWVYDRTIPSSSILAFGDFRGNQLQSVEFFRDYRLWVPVVGFVICFWISSLSANLVRAGLISLVAFVGAVPTAGLSLAWVFQGYIETPGPAWFMNLEVGYSRLPAMERGWIETALFAAPLLLLLVFAAKNFRASDISSRRKRWQAVSFYLAIAAVAMTVGVGETGAYRVDRFASRQYRGVEAQLVQAVNLLVAASGRPDDDQVYSWAQIESTGALTPDFRQRFSGSLHTLSVTHHPVRKGGWYYTRVSIKPGLEIYPPMHWMFSRFTLGMHRLASSVSPPGR